MNELTFDEAKARLEEIANLVEDPDISLDDALALYEEAVKIGLHACDVSEQGILTEEPEEGPAAEEASVEADVEVEASAAGVLPGDDGQA